MNPRDGVGFPPSPEEWRKMMKKYELIKKVESRIMSFEMDRVIMYWQCPVCQMAYGHKGKCATHDIDLKPVFQQVDENT